MLTDSKFRSTRVAATPFRLKTVQTLRRPYLLVRPSRSIAALALAASVALLNGCTLSHLPETARTSALHITSQAVDYAESCLAERVAQFPEGTAVVDFAATLGPCVNVWLLGKTDQEIKDAFHPSGSGTYIVTANGEPPNGTFRLITIGAGSAIAGAWSDRLTAIVCWSLPIDLSTRATGAATDVPCDPRVTQAWGNPKEEMTLSQIVRN